MTFKELTDECVALRGNESDRARIKQCLNLRYAELWSLEQWSFRISGALVTITAGNRIVQNLPPNFGTSIGLWLSDGTRLPFVPISAYPERFSMIPAQAGRPEIYTLSDNQLVVDPAPRTTEQATLRYENKLTPLSADLDVPTLPAEYHYGLVPGALGLYLSLVNDPTYALMEQQWQAVVEAMRGQYLSIAYDGPLVWGRDALFS